MHEWVKGDVSGNFGKIMTGSIVPRYTYWATCVKEAVKGLGTDNRSLIELTILADQYDVEAIKNEYFRLFQLDIHEDIADDISKSNDWARLVKAWWSSFRYARNQVQRDAEALMKAAKGAGTDEQVFIEILSTSTPEEYKQIAEAYRMMYKKELRDVIIAEFSGKSEYCYLLAHDFLIDPCKACAFCLFKAMKGAGTRDKSMVHTTVLFRDRYQQNINQWYQHLAGEGLAKAIKGDTSGWYEKALLALWKAQ